MSEGVSYPEAYQSAVETVCPQLDASVLTGPNDILAVCYLREIIRQDASLEPVAVARKGAGHGSAETEDGIASASVIREMICSGSDAWKQFVPGEMRSVLASSVFSPEELKRREERLFSLARFAVLTSGTDALSQLPEVSEGLENRITASARSADSFDDLVRRISTDRYKSPRVRRVPTQLMLGISKDTVSFADNCCAAYAKVLALNGRGAEILRTAKEKGTVPVWSNINKNVDPSAPEAALLDLDIRSADIYSIICGRPVADHSDKVMVPKVLKL